MPLCWHYHNNIFKDYIMNLKVLFLTLASIITLGNQCYARDGEEYLNLQNVGHHGDHGEYYDPADLPEVYYDRSNQEIILVADGFVSSYDVDIVSLSTLQVVLFTAVNGYGDTIDVSTLTDDNYKIVISTPYNNIYEGYFTNY